MSAERISPDCRRRWRVYLDLGRVSNLPTVWTNCLAGIALSAAVLETPALLILTASLSCFYTGGMFLNDAFDHRHDEKNRARRPIPSGEAGLLEVYAVGFGFLALGQLGLFAVSAAQSFPRMESLGAGMLLCVLILYYNYRHKTDPLSPVVMALCRGLVYLIAGSMAAGSLSGGV
jgi:4-hydroxybenzoate polyprenyltransferase